jgi:hypothetical protein
MEYDSLSLQPLFLISALNSVIRMVFSTPCRSLSFIHYAWSTPSRGELTHIHSNFLSPYSVSTATSAHRSYQVRQSYSESAPSISPLPSHDRPHPSPSVRSLEFMINQASFSLAILPLHLSKASTNQHFVVRRTIFSDTSPFTTHISTKTPETDTPVPVSCSLCFSAATI